MSVCPGPGRWDQEELLLSWLVLGRVARSSWPRPSPTAASFCALSGSERVFMLSGWALEGE